MSLTALNLGFELEVFPLDQDVFLSPVWYKKNRSFETHLVDTLSATSTRTSTIAHTDWFTATNALRK